MRTVLQSQATECSLACLVMVASAHGLNLDLASARRRFPVSIKGADLKQLMSQAAALGFNTRALRLRLSELRELSLPCILHWDLNHFVVLKKIARNRVVVLDPAVGERRLTRAEISRHFTGVALELAPNAEFQPQAAKPRLALSQLTGHVVGAEALTAADICRRTCARTLRHRCPALQSDGDRRSHYSGDRDLLAVLVLGFGLLLVAQTAIGLARSWMVMVLGQTLSLQWTGNLFAHLVRLPPDFFEKRHLGDVASRFASVSAILSRVGVIRPPRIGIYRPLERPPKDISKRVLNGAILPR